MTEGKAATEGPIFQDPPAATVKRGPSGRPPGRPPKDRPTPPRRSTAPLTRVAKDGMENSLTMLYGFAGAVVEGRGVTFTRSNPEGTGLERVWQPSLAGRAMKLGSPAAGKQLSDWISGIPFLSGILGPILGNTSFSTLASVAGLPVLLHVLQVRPEAAGMVQPLVTPLLADLFVSIKKAEKEQRAAMAALTEDFDNDEFQGWISAIFQVPEQVMPETEEVQPPEPGEPDYVSPNGNSPVDDGFSQIDAELGLT